MKRVIVAVKPVYGTLRLPCRTCRRPGWTTHAGDRVSFGEGDVVCAGEWDAVYLGAVVFRLGLE